MLSLGLMPCEHPDKLHSPETRVTFYLILKTARLDKTPEREGQTDRLTDLPWLLQRSVLRAMRTRCKDKLKLKLKSRLNKKLNSSFK